MLKTHRLCYEHPVSKTNTEYGNRPRDIRGARYTRYLARYLARYFAVPKFWSDLGQKSPKSSKNGPFWVNFGPKTLVRNKIITKLIRMKLIKTVRGEINTKLLGV